jgi:hypothetical protein
VTGCGSEVGILGTATWTGKQNEQFSEKHCILGRNALLLDRFTDVSEAVMTSSFRIEENQEETT